jgi:hypothetical protein
MESSTCTPPSPARSLEATTSTVYFAVCVCGSSMVVLVNIACTVHCDLCSNFSEHYLFSAVLPLLSIVCFVAMSYFAL